MRLIDRLIFGTARLAGGGCARASRQLIEDCCAAGLTRFDTAPPYGMGAAELLLGETVGDASDVIIHTKAGLPRPVAPSLRGWAKRARANIVAQSQADWIPQLPSYTGPDKGGQYTALALQNSIDRSHRLLRRGTFDLLLLHSAEPEGIPTASWQIFHEERRTGRAHQIGFAHAGPATRASASHAIQIAPRARDFAKPSDERRIFHSVRTAAAIALPRTDDATADLIVGLVQLATLHPHAQLIFATTSRERLRRLLTATSAIEIPEQGA